MVNLLENNVFDTALVLEGGGMRGSYTAGAINALLESEVYLDYVCGISSGAANLVNYIARLPKRSRQSSVDIAEDRFFAGKRSLLTGHGVFNLDRIYYEMTQEGELLELPYERFQANPAKWRIGAYNAARGACVYFSSAQVDSELKLAHVCKASSSMPVVTPVTLIAGEPYMDGAIGASGGIPLDVAELEGYRKFFVVLTRPRGYVKETSPASRLANHLLGNYPLAARALRHRAENYNRTLARLRGLEAEGQAYLFYPENMRVQNYEDDPAKLATNFEAGYTQMTRELPAIRDFLGLV
ncbi:MAG: patatin family protein [Mobiluncus porci]|uniref:patatin-like phospholipase family protein n=1 Tax=Mobiluncus TaxID=2050 RepID=UPI0023EF8D22|nr:MULTISPECIES: patatin family protein [Mobiluncus]MCI6583734.1 patatin family protein [Mobiluncus sp.]MDD7541971.1 patatin family protein [Mobiluncus porci]MDY5747593.1 patatin family protein [Mobiluncus porci]